ncbi:hypothetical protein E6P78_01380 [Streptomyces sp. A0958]|nr:hypothetical protein E6P78_01380 [Streptomyces sp. A0958]
MTSALCSDRGSVTVGSPEDSNSRAARHRSKAVYGGLLAIPPKGCLMSIAPTAPPVVQLRGGRQSTSLSIQVDRIVSKTSRASTHSTSRSVTWIAYSVPSSAM